ncbi:MAG: DegV family protein [Oscillospiraceae bacterium]|nr:DegV family protein [Oscillospiraceae bacterium]
MEERETEKILITCDSALDVDEDLAKKYNIRILPIVITMNDEELFDVEDVKAQDILDYHDKTGELAVTSPPTVPQTFRFFTRFVHMGYTVIHLSMSSGMSPAYQNAMDASQTFGRVHVIDTKEASVGGAMLAIHAAEMRQNGASSQEIIQAIKSMIPRICIPFLIDEMEFLYQGGRASGLSAFMAGLLKIKPSLYIDSSNGTLVVNKKYMGKFDAAALKFLNENIKNGENMEKKHFILAHTGCSQDFLDACVTEIDKLVHFQEIHVIRAGSTITSHLGKNCIILCWLNKS